MFENSKWIWHEYLAGENIYCNFRTSFEAGIHAEAKLSVSAQHFFRAYVNGHEIGGLASPSPSVFLKRMRYLEYDITPYLQEGENVLAFTVLYLGGEGQNRSRGIPSLLFDCLVTEMDGRIYHVVSDTSCRCTDQTAYTQHLPFREMRRLTASTQFDPSREEKGWKIPGFLDVHWKKAVISPAYFIRPALMRQEIPEGTRKQSWTPSLLLSAENSSVYDAGEILTGYVRVVFHGKKGAVLTLRYGELLEGERNFHGQVKKNKKLSLHPEHSASNDQTETYWDQYVVEGGGQEIWEECFTYKAFRYFELTGVQDAVIEKVEVVKTGTALELTGSFSCDSTLLNEMMHSCIRTQENALLGMTVDCPHREQAQYLGDSLMQSHTLLYNFTDAYFIICKTLQDFTDGQAPDGHFPWVCPCDCTPGGQFSLRMPEYDPLFVSLLWKAYQWSGDVELLKRFYPSALRMAVHYLSLRNENGLIPKDQKLATHISDWPYPTVDETDDVLFMENIYLLRAVRFLAQISQILQLHEDLSFWKEQAKGLSAAIQQWFYDPEQCLFRDTPHSLHHHPGINAVAWMEELFPLRDRAAAKNQIASLPFETSVILSFEYLSFLFENGYRQKAFELIADPNERWGKMIAEGSRTIWEGFEDIESHSHAWNCYPLYLFQRYVLGIEPISFGFERIRVAPFFPDPLTKLKGSIQTPHGILTLCCQRLDHEANFSVEIPDCMHVDFVFGSTKIELESGIHKINIPLIS